MIDQASGISPGCIKSSSAGFKMKQLPFFERDRAKAEALIADLARTLHAVSADLAAEETRTGITDVSNPAYSLFARYLRTRHDNLSNTIAEIRARLPRLIDEDRPAC